MSDFVLQTKDAKTLPSEQYSGLMFKSFFEIINVCGNPESSDSAVSKRIEFLTKIIINFIINDETRSALKTKRKEQVLEAQDKLRNKELTSSEYNDLLFDINTDIIGEVMSTCDDFLGLVERQAIMPVLLDAKIAELEKKFYGSGEPGKNEAGEGELIETEN